jgi:hypothetical protein
LVAESSLPLATCCAAVDNVTADPHVPFLASVTPVHVAVTAEAGTVKQPLNEAELACTDRVQVLPFEPPVVVQLIVAAEFPDTVSRSGSVDVKLIVLGLADMALKVVPPPIGKTLFDGTTTRALV